VLLVNDDLFEREGGQGLNWLAWQQNTPMVFLSDRGVNLQRAYELGAGVCLSRKMAIEHPPLLAAALEEAMRSSVVRQGYRRTRERLADSRRHVDRLVNMMWRTSARMADGRWLSQRAMLDRLSEELARVERHQIPLSLAIGEVRPVDDVAPDYVADDAMGQFSTSADVGRTFLSVETDKSVRPTKKDAFDDSLALPEWTMDLIAKGKRRSDVVGQYGPGGFMILMTHTPVQGGIHCCRRLQIAIEHAQNEMPGPHTDLHAYFGIAGAAKGKLSAAVLLRAAEQNLEAARADSKARLAVDSWI